MSHLMKLNLETLEGETHEVTAVFADLIKYDVLRAKYSFPKKEESEFLFMGLVAYAALIRTGVVKSDVSVEKFLNTIATVEPIESEGDNAGL